MKAISLWQPWATLIAIGAKRFETRSWDTNYRGPLAIHAAKRKVDIYDINPTIGKALLEPGFTGTGQLPLGCIVCTVELVYTLRTHEAPRGASWRDEEAYFGDFTPGRFAWRLDDVKPVDNIPARGSQGFWEWLPPQEISAP